VGRAQIAERLMAIGREYAALPDGAATDPGAAIDYDESGAPR